VSAYVHILFELWQLSCACHSFFVDKYRWENFQITLSGMYIKHEVYKCSFQFCTHAFINCKALACNFYSSLKVEYIQRLSYLPMGLWSERKLSWLSNNPYNWIVILILAYWSCRRGDIWDIEHYLIYF